MKKVLILLFVLVLCAACDGTWLIDPVPDPVIVHTYPYYGPYRPYWDRPIYINPPRPIFTPNTGRIIGPVNRGNVQPNRGGQSNRGGQPEGRR